jgi:hypothetical protein
MIPCAAWPSLPASCTDSRTVLTLVGALNVMLFGFPDVALGNDLKFQVQECFIVTLGKGSSKKPAYLYVSGVGLRVNVDLDLVGLESWQVEGANQPAVASVVIADRVL